MVYQMVSRTDPETMRFLNDDIMLFVQANPDGQELIANWYMRGSENPNAPLKPEQERSMNGLPRLYRQVHRARRQSRLLHVQHEGNHQHEPHSVP